MATTFGAWMGASNQQDRVWHSAVEQLVYQESKWISEFVRKITDTHATLKGVCVFRYTIIIITLFHISPCSLLLLRDKLIPCIRLLYDVLIINVLCVYIYVD